MRQLKEIEIHSVHGAVCENMTLAECIDGVGEQLVEEVKTVAAAAGEAWDRWSEYNQVGHWVYEWINC